MFILWELLTIMRFIQASREDGLKIHVDKIMQKHVTNWISATGSWSNKTSENNKISKSENNNKYKECS
jgi:hypothetical protein